MKNTDCKEIDISRVSDDKIVIADGYVTLNYRFSYEIKLSRIKDEASLLRWVRHLAGKNWMNLERLCIFIDKVGTFKRFNIDEVD